MQFNKLYSFIERLSAMSEKKVGVKGKVVHSQAREIIANVMKFMKREADNGSPLVPLSNFKARVLAATGIGETSYRKIQKEAQEIEEGTMLILGSG